MAGAEQGCIKTSLTGQIWTGQTQPDLELTTFSPGLWMGGKKPEGQTAKAI